MLKGTSFSAQFRLLGYNGSLGFYLLVEEPSYSGPLPLCPVLLLPLSASSLMLFNNKSAFLKYALSLEPILLNLAFGNSL